MALVTPIVNLYTMANLGVMSRKIPLAGTRLVHPKIRFFNSMLETSLEIFTILKRHVKIEIPSRPFICQLFYLDMNLLVEFPLQEKQASMLQLQKHVKLNATPEKQDVMLGLLFPTKSKHIDLKIAKMFRRLTANTVPFHLGTKGQHILGVPLMIQPMAKPGARLQLIQLEKSLMENGETVKMDVMFVRRCKIKIAFSHSNTKERRILNVLPIIQRMEKLGVQQK